MDNQTEQLAKLHELYKKKILTEDEYQKKKAEILNSLQSKQTTSTNETNETQSKLSFGFAVTSLIIGIIGILASLSRGLWRYDELIGAVILSCIGIFLGVLSLKGQESKSQISIVGIVTSSLSLIMLMFFTKYINL